MAVQVVKQRIKCLECSDELLYSRQDCSIKVVRKPVPESVHHSDGDYYTTEYRFMGTYEEWYLTCPVCGKTMKVKEVLKSRVPLK